jgi:hypothetical protein
MKKRPESHIVDTAGAQLLRSALPDAWVVRPYQPDYGIDFAVEVFDSFGDGFVSLGEHFFIQLKSHSNVKWIKKQVHARYNVEKGPLTYDRAVACEIAVSPEPIETAELQLARSMGPAVAFLLVIADTTRSEAHWVCLNDFVDKVLIPEVSDLSTQSSHTVYLPNFNRINRTDSALLPIRFLARRAKLYAAFNRFRYQRHEVYYALGRYRASPDHQAAVSDLLRLVDHFLATVLAYDFWKTTYAWPAIELTYIHTEATATLVKRALGGEPLQSIFESLLRNIPVADEAKAQLPEFLLASDIQSTFDRLANLGNMFEEICREWFLPTYLGNLAEEHAIR